MAEEDASWRASAQVGDRCDALDCHGGWFEAVIVPRVWTTSGDDRLRVHFVGWSSEFDEMHARDSRRLQPPWTRVPRWRDALEVGHGVDVAEPTGGAQHRFWLPAHVVAAERGMVCVLPTYSTATCPATPMWLARDADDIAPLYRFSRRTPHGHSPGDLSLLANPLARHTAGPSPPPVCVLVTAGDAPRVTAALRGEGTTCQHCDLLRIAASGGIDVLEAVLQKMRGGTRPGVYLDALHDAAQSTHADRAAAVRALLTTGVDVNGTAWPDDVTPLMRASARGALDVVRVLLDVGGAALDATDLRGRSALMYATGGVGDGRTRDVVSLLCDSGAEARAKALEYATRARPAVVAAIGQFGGWKRLWIRCCVRG